MLFCAVPISLAVACVPNVLPWDPWMLPCFPADARSSPDLGTTAGKSRGLGCKRSSRPRGCVALVALRLHAAASESPRYARVTLWTSYTGEDKEGGATPGGHIRHIPPTVCLPLGTCYAQPPCPMPCVFLPTKPSHSGKRQGSRSADLTASWPARPAKLDRVQ